MQLKIKFSSIIERSLILFIFSLVFLYDLFVEVLGVLDEIVGFISLLVILFFFFVKGKLKLFRNEYYITFFLLFIALIGLWSNFNSQKNGHITDTNAILGDFIIFFKAFIAYLAIRLLAGSFNSEKVLNILSKYLKQVFYLLAFMVIIDKIFKIYPQYPRYGISSTELFFQHPSRYGFAFAFIFLVLIPKYYKKNMGLLLAILFFGMLSLRVKYLGFMALAIIIIFLGKRLFKVPKMFFIITITILSFLLLWFFWDTFEMYFTFTSLNVAWSRAVVLYYSFIIGNDFFPFGTGFGTFSSYYSGLYYSWVYDFYGINNVYGISRLYWGFMADQYWPMILGQFGYLGLISMILMLYNYFKLFFNNLKANINNPKYYIFLSAVLGLFMLLIDSTSDAIFSQQRGVVVFMYFALVINTVGKKHEE